LEESKKNIYIVATGKLTDDDYDQMLPLLKRKIEEYDKINWYFQMKDFKGWTPHAFWRDVKFDLQNANKLNRVAMVGEKKWHELMTDMMKPFTSAEIKYFDEADADKAREWISKS